MVVSEGDTPDIPAIAAEFPRPVELNMIGKSGRHLKFQAADDERAALARRYSVVSVDSLEVECDIVPVRKGHFRLDGRYVARIVQLCVVSLDPVEEDISADFTLSLQRMGQGKSPEITDIDFTPDEEDIEFLNSDIFDAGELIAQYLSLEINSYPRKQGVSGSELGQKIVKEEDYHIVTEAKNPFDVLKTLKHKT